MDITLNFSYGKRYITLDKKDGILQLKNKIYKEFELLHNEYILICKGKILNDTVNLSYYKNTKDKPIEIFIIKTEPIPTRFPY